MKPPPQKSGKNHDVGGGMTPTPRPLGITEYTNPYTFYNDHSSYVSLCSRVCNSHFHAKKSTKSSDSYNGFKAREAKRLGKTDCWKRLEKCADGSECTIEKHLHKISDTKDRRCNTRATTARHAIDESREEGVMRELGDNDALVEMEGDSISTHEEESANTPSSDDEEGDLPPLVGEEEDEEEEYECDSLIPDFTVATREGTPAEGGVKMLAETVTEQSGTKQDRCNDKDEKRKFLLKIEERKIGYCLGEEGVEAYHGIWDRIVDHLLKIGVTRREMSAVAGDPETVINPTRDHDDVLFGLVRRRTAQHDLTMSAFSRVYDYSYTRGVYVNIATLILKDDRVLPFSILTPEKKEKNGAFERFITIAHKIVLDNKLDFDLETLMHTTSYVYTTKIVLETSATSCKGLASKKMEYKRRMTHPSNVRSSFTPHKLKIEQNLHKEPYIDNGLVKPIAGLEYYSDTVGLDFPELLPIYDVNDRNRFSGAYRTVFGPTIPMAAQICACDNHALNVAFMRLTNCRGSSYNNGVCLACNTHIPENFRSDHFDTIEHRTNTIAFDARLVQNQEKFISDHAAAFAELKRLYSISPETRDKPEDDVEVLIERPHAKKQMRQECYKQLTGVSNQFGGVYEGKQSDRDLLESCGDERGRNLTVTSKGWYSNKNMAKMKSDEISKVGKKQRIVVDLKVAASLEGSALTEKIKKAMAANEFVYRGITIEFIPYPRAESLESVFTKLQDPPGKGYMAYFSDDSCISLRDASGAVHTYNVDISQCDGSHHSTFDALRQIVPDDMSEQIEALLDQLIKPKLAIEPGKVDGKKQLNGDGKPIQVLFRLQRLSLLSGSTLTTVINNIANIMIAMSIADQYTEIRHQLNSDYETSADRITEIIETASQNCGYIVTAERCYDYSDIQFLKHSPMYDTNGRLTAVPNFGILLRSIGVCRGDPPGKKCVTTQQRAGVFNHSLIHSIYPRVSADILTEMKRSAALDQTGLSDSLYRSTLFLATNQINKNLAYKIDPETDHPETYLSPVSTKDRPTRYFTSEAFFRRYTLGNPNRSHLTPNEVETFTQGLGKARCGESWGCAVTERILKTDYGLGLLEF